RTCAAAIASSSASPAVRSRPASPRTPSVPNSRVTNQSLRFVPVMALVVAMRTSMRRPNAQSVDKNDCGPLWPLVLLTSAGRAWDLSSGDTSSRGRVARHGHRSGLPLGVLRRLAGLLETGLLPLDLAGVPGEVAGLLQHRAVVLGVHGGERAGEAVTERTGLAAGATAVQAGEDVVGALESQRDQGLLDQLLVHLVREVGFERLAVDLPLTAAGDDTDARDSGLAPPG